MARPRLRVIGGLPRRGHCALVLLVLIIGGVPGSALGAKWSIQPMPTPPGSLYDSQFAAVSCASVSACTAVGERDNSGLGEQTLAERWDGHGWTVQTTPNPGVANNHVLSGVSCTSPAVCMAVGSYGDDRFFSHVFAERWTSSRWTAVAIPSPTSNDTELTAVSCASHTACMAVGWYRADFAEVPLAERWDGRTWTTEPTPSLGPSGGYLSSVSCVSASACVAVGIDWGGWVPLAERWDGTRWSIQSIPNPPGGEPNLRAVSCASAAACTAVGGNYVTVSPGVAASRSVAERWDGSRWTVQAMPPVAGVVSLAGVSCASAHTCVAVGTSLQPLAERWDGTRWNVEASEPDGKGATLEAVSCATVSVCTAVGYTYEPAGSLHTLVERSGVPALATAKLSGIPAGCVRSKLTAQVVGTAIASVRWSLDRKLIRGRTVHRGTRYAAVVRPTPGRHRLTVTVTFTNASGAPARIFKRTILGCRR